MTPEQLGLVRDHEHKVRKLAAVTWSRTPYASVFDADDLFSEGMIALAGLAVRYDPNRIGPRTGRKSSFWTFAAPRVHGAMLDEYRRHDIVPRSTRSRRSVVDKAVLSLQTTDLREPSIDRIADYMGRSFAEIERCLVDSGAGFVSFEETPRESRDDETLRMEDLFGDGCDVRDHVSRMQLRDRMSQMVRNPALLEDRERRAVVAYYFEELTMRQIGLMFGVSESRVSQILSKARSRMGKALQNHAFADFF